MADQRNLSDIIAELRETSRQAERRAKRRVVVTTLLALCAACYMTWLHAEFSKLDAQAVTEIARTEVQARLPEIGDRVTQMALDAAPDLMDRGEEALLSAPSAILDNVEERLADKTDEILAEVSATLDRELDAFVGPRLEELEKLSEGGDPPPLDDLMSEVRAKYREQASGLMAEIYVAYANEIGGVNDYLLHLKTGEELTRRQKIEKEIIEASVALRRHYVDPIEPIGIAEETTQK
jgi:type VI protein secretion system component VasK